MKKGTHGLEEKSFEELSYAGQAKSLNAQILIIEKAIKAHVKRAQVEGKNIVEMKVKYLKQLNKLIKALN